MHSRFRYKCAYQKIINCSACCAACYVNLDLKKKIYLDVGYGSASFRFAETWKVLLNSDPKLSPDERWQLRIVIDTDHPRKQMHRTLGSVWTVWLRTTNELPWRMEIRCTWHCSELASSSVMDIRSHWIELLHCPLFMLRRVVNFLH